MPNIRNIESVHPSNLYFHFVGSYIVIVIAHLKNGIDKTPV